MAKYLRRSCFGSSAFSLDGVDRFEDVDDRECCVKGSIKLGCEGGCDRRPVLDGRHGGLEGWDLLIDSNQSGVSAD